MELGADKDESCKMKIFNNYSLFNQKLKKLSKEKCQSLISGLKKSKRIFKIRMMSTSDYLDYCHYLENRNFNRRKEFVPLSEHSFQRRDSDTRIIAYYLPQYYQIDVNDKFHGKGFTEWTSASQAIPLYVGHNQPHLPYDLAFYNLLNIDILKRQAELAQQYGVYGFCIHWYWFSGVRTMEKPLKLLLDNPEIDIHYCINWATENWTSLWDGGNNEVIFEQKLQEGDDYKLFCDLLPYFKDTRYIRIDNKPLFSIYNVFVFEKQRLTKLILNLKKYAKDAGFEGLYITLTNSGHFSGNAEEYGADAIQEFSPSCLPVNPYKVHGYINPNFCGSIYDYADLVNNKKYFINYLSKKYYRSVLLAFDNSSRKAYKPSCVIFQGNTAQLFESWLKDVLQESKKIHKKEEDYVFINNWNEWAEGSHLEPDLRYGYAYLQSLKNAIESVRELDETIVEKEISKVSNNQIINFFVHCIESFGDIVACEPIARWLKKQSPKSKVHWIIKKQYKDLIAFNPNIDDVIEVECLSSSIDICNEKMSIKGNIIIDCHYNGRRCTKTGRLHYNPNNVMVNESTYLNYGSLLQSFCLSSGMPAINDAPIFWEDKKAKLNIQLPHKYIVFHCKSAEKIKDWDDKKWNNLATELMNDGVDVVEIGQKKTIHSRNNHYFDLTDINDFQKIALVIKKSSLFCSVDSGFAHIANCNQIPSCIIMGKYKNFNYPMPYTGYFAEHKEFILYAKQQPASTIDISLVLERIKKLYKQ